MDSNNTLDNTTADGKALGIVPDIKEKSIATSLLGHFRRFYNLTPEEEQKSREIFSQQYLGSY